MIISVKVMRKIILELVEKISLYKDAESRRILDAVSDYGFASHANFTRAIKEIFGIVLKEYKKNTSVFFTTALRNQGRQVILHWIYH